MGSALGIIGSFLGKIGSGIFKSIKNNRAEKRNAQKMKKVMSYLEGDNKRWNDYLEGLNEVYDKLGKKTRRDINKVFSDQRKQLKNAIQQRRIPEYLAGVEKLSKSQSEAISDAMLNIKQAELGAKGQGLKTSFAQKQSIASMLPMVQSLYSTKQTGGIGQALQGALSPFTQWFEKESGNKIQDWLTQLNAKEPDRTKNTYDFGTENTLKTGTDYLTRGLE